MHRPAVVPVTEPSPVNDLLIDLIQSDEVDDRFSSPVEARKKAMDYLARREHSRDELRRKMEKFGFDSDVSLDAIEQLRKDGLQSDHRFAEAFFQSRISQDRKSVV